MITHGDLETLAFPAAAFQNGRLALREAGPVGSQLDARAASGQGLLLLAMVPRGIMPSRAEGPSTATRSRTRAPRCIAGSLSQRSGLLQHLCLRSSLDCLRSAASSPARSA